MTMSNIWKHDNTYVANIIVIPVPQGYMANTFYVRLCSDNLIPSCIPPKEMIFNFQWKTNSDR